MTNETLTVKRKVCKELMQYNVRKLLFVFWQK